MPRRFTADGAEWMVLPSGRNTQYVRDELGLTFTRRSGAPEQRILRYSPGRPRARARPFARLTAAPPRSHAAGGSRVGQRWACADQSGGYRPIGRIGNHLA